MRFHALVLISCFALPFAAQAETTEQIFQSIADTAVTGNGGAHYVTKLKGKFNQKKEMAKLKREANPRGNECKYSVVASIKDGINEMSNSWDDDRTANRIEGMAAKGMIRQIIYSDWDVDSGDSEYCLMSTMKVYAKDGTVLVLDYNETD